jgi:hypothetical protein
MINSNKNFYEFYNEKGKIETFCNQDGLRCVAEDLPELLGTEISDTFRGKDEEEVAVKYCESDFETPDELELWVVKESSLEELTPEDVDIKNENEVKVAVDLILANCIHFEMTSEVYRSFYANKVK